MNYELSIEKLSEKEIEIFTTIKAAAYADDRLKVEFDDIEKPSWFDGEWYVGLGILNIEETKRLMKEFSCYLIYRMEEPIGGFWVHVEEEDSLTLEDFCILPQYQGKGYGTKSLQLIENYFGYNKRWLLTTPYFCKRNCHLYEKNGYKKTRYVSNNTVVVYEKHVQ